MARAPGLIRVQKPPVFKVYHATIQLANRHDKRDPFCQGNCRWLEAKTSAHQFGADFMAFKKSKLSTSQLKKIGRRYPMENKSAIYLTPAEAAEVLRLKKQTLARLRHEGKGPNFIKTFE